MMTAVLSAEGAAASVEIHRSAPARTTAAPAAGVLAAQAPVTAPPAVTSAAASAKNDQDGDPECLSVKGAEVCVGPDGSDRPGIWVEDTARGHGHAAVEYFLNGYLGTKYVIHNLGRAGEIRGTHQIGKVVTFRAAIYSGDRLIKVGRWKTVRNVTEHPVKRDTRVTPATARARAKVCTSARGASVCFGERKTFIFACDTSADKFQARAEYFVGGDPTARFEIHQLAGENTCGKAEHGNLAISMYRASLFNEDRLVSTQLYRYN
ncbi:hypothetical protein HII36_35620 [Nonomuraea sp. NN258]|uniref:hypothetical protein n=1 Tax=Nonomuraea antri TaxID=2730852 RepID=UPI00156A1950|nr:hypothetical protein [Nonomuraea antri]NRQ37126.1 hypothetical protein [Nonomuraea antri]